MVTSGVLVCRNNELEMVCVSTSKSYVQKPTKSPSPVPGALEISVWSYAPSLLAKGNAVDRLSLYLSLKESQDERIEAALEEMMRELQW